jgi:hypothetical protein
MQTDILPLQQKYSSSQHTASRLASAHANDVAMLLGYLVSTVPPDSATCWPGMLRIVAFWNFSSSNRELRLQSANTTILTHCSKQSTKQS